MERTNHCIHRSLMVAIIQAMMIRAEHQHILKGIVAATSLVNDVCNIT
jgi:hypothetical protein